MSAYLQKLRMARMSITYGDKIETRRILENLAPAMLPNEMALIIYQAILSKNLTVVKYCLDELYNANLLRHCTWSGTNLLHLAVEMGSLEAIEILLEREIYCVNAVNANGARAIALAYEQNDYCKMNLLLKYGAHLYIRGYYTRYISLRQLPEATTQYLILCIAREEIEKRLINKDDVQALKLYHPHLYQTYLHCRAEWIELRKTKFVKGISYRDLIEFPIQTFLHVSRTVQYRTKEKRDPSCLFPIYGATVELALDKIRKEREEWENKEVLLNEITYELVPSPIVEKIAYFLCLD